MSENMAENSILGKIISAHDGDMALLYLFMSSSPNASADDAAAALCMTMRQINDAREKLERIGALPSGGSVSPAPAVKKERVSPEADRLPEYSREVIAQCTRDDPAFKAVIDEAAKVFGRPVSVSELQKLAGIYKYLAIPAEVIMILLNYCSELCRVKFGGMRTPTASSLEKEAFTWARREVRTLDAADEYIESRRKLWDGITELKGVFGITDRALTTSEWNAVERWLSCGFDVSAIALAYDRTVSKTGELKWNYLNRIVTNWHEKGLHTVEEIEQKEGRRGSKVQAAASVDASQASSLDEKMIRFINDLKNGDKVHGV